MSELRQEHKCSFKFILNVIKDNPSLPQITKSDYYYQISKVDKDLKNNEIMNKIRERSIIVIKADMDTVESLFN